LKVVIVLDRFPVLTETFILNQIKGLVDAGIRVEIFSYNKGVQFISSQLSDIIKDSVSYKETMPVSKIKRFSKAIKIIHRDLSLISFSKLLNALNFFKFGKRALSLELFYQSYWFLKKEENDIIHAHFGHVGLHIAKLKHLGFLQKEKFIITLHGYYIEEKFFKHNKTKYQFLLKHANKIIVNTPYSFNFINKHFPSFKQLEILPVGLDTQFYKPKKLKEDYNFTIIFCGRLVPLKGPDLAILIFNELIDRGFSNISLEVIGDGEMKGILSKMITEYKLEAKVKLRGFLNDHGIKEIMNKGSAFLMPGIYDTVTGKAETQGLVIQEAQAMELPVVISNAGGMKYGMIDGQTGYVVKQGDVKEFANKIESLIMDRKSREKMGKRGREFVVKNYDNKVINTELLFLYNSIM